jgi:hypothetical protein
MALVRALLASWLAEPLSSSCMGGAELPFLQLLERGLVCRICHEVIVYKVRLAHASARLHEREILFILLLSP